MRGPVIASSPKRWHRPSLPHHHTRDPPQRFSASLTPHETRPLVRAAEGPSHRLSKRAGAPATDATVLLGSGGGGSRVSGPHHSTSAPQSPHHHERGQAAATSPACVLVALAFYLRYGRRYRDHRQRPRDPVHPDVGRAAPRHARRDRVPRGSGPVRRGGAGRRSARGARLPRPISRADPAPCWRPRPRRFPGWSQITPARSSCKISPASSGGFIVAALDESAADAPFSRWAAALGFGEGVAMHALASLRGLLPDDRSADPARRRARAGDL